MSKPNVLPRWETIGARSRPTPPDNPDARCFIGCGPERFTDRALIAWSRSDAGIADTGWRELLALPQHWIMPVFPIKAADFMKRGIEKGPALGAALAAAEAAWIAADFPADEKTLAAIIERATDAAKG